MNEPTLTDIELDCRDCGIPFVWNAGEQRFYAERQISQPKRCKECRIRKKASYAMAERVADLLS